LEPTVSEANFNPVTYPVVKRISFLRIANPKNTEGGITDPTNHAANFAQLMVIAYPRGQTEQPRQLDTLRQTIVK